MKNQIINRGSEWRKWDLHLHSLKTYLNNQYCNISEDEFINKILESELSVIGLTNYFKFSDEDFLLKKKLEEKGVTVFLNLELRLSYQNDKEKLCDFHIIFDNNLTKEIINQFLANLEVNCGIVMKKASNLDSTDIEKGCVEFDKTLSLLESESLELRGKYLTGILTRGSGSSRSSNCYSKFVEQSDLIIHSFDKQENIIKDKKYFDDTGKPVLQNSDAHSLEQIGKKFSWIKADCSFEGLKQILYEYKTRISIQDMKPDLKNGYALIDSIELNEPDFWKQTIYFNPNLNTIIGGRSTGKSSLLKVINNKICNEKFNDPDDCYLSDKLENIKINWINTESNSDIEYFPQGYMWEISNDNNKFDKVIQSIINEREQGVKIEEYNTEREQKVIDIAAQVATVFTVNTQIDEKKSILKENGNSKAIENEILKINQQIEKLSPEKDILQRKIEDYHKIITQINDYQTLIDVSDLFRKKVNDLKNVEIISNEVKTQILSFTEENDALEIKETFSRFEQKVKEEWLNFIDGRNKLSESLQSENSSKIVKLRDSQEYLNGETLKNDNQFFNQLNLNLETEKRKLETAQKIERELQKQTEKNQNVLDRIIKEHVELVNRIHTLCTILSSNEKDLDISANCKIKETALFDFLSARINKQKHSDYIQSFINNYKTKHDEETVRDFVEELLSQRITLKAGNQYQSIASEFLCRDWFSISYIVKYQGDDFSEMSPGKKAFVVLKLLLEFSKKKCPILIDQPEDSLDNRAIFKDLVAYIKQKKTERQIILVTHNANIVVSADAEQVIVANQHGKDSLNTEGVKFQYISGALENSRKRDNNVEIVLMQQGIRQHVCEILEGGEDAFELREKKYRFYENKNN